MLGEFNKKLLINDLKFIKHKSSAMSELDSQIKKKAPKPFSIESLIGDRKSPEIDIENSITDNKNSEEEENERLDGINRMRYYLNTPFLQQNNFPFLLGYPEPFLRMFGQPPVQASSEEKRESPVSVGSEMESDGGDDNTQGR